MLGRYALMGQGMGYIPGWGIKGKQCRQLKKKKEKNNKQIKIIFKTLIR